VQRAHEPLASFRVVGLEAHGAMQVEAVTRRGEAERTALEIRIGGGVSVKLAVMPDAQGHL
jgi:hypothetical protein